MTSPTPTLAPAIIPARSYRTRGSLSALKTSAGALAALTKDKETLLGPRSTTSDPSGTATTDVSCEPVQYTDKGKARQVDPPSPLSPPPVGGSADLHTGSSPPKFISVPVSPVGCAGSFPSLQEINSEPFQSALRIQDLRSSFSQTAAFSGELFTTPRKGNSEVESANSSAVGSVDGHSDNGSADGPWQFPSLPQRDKARSRTASERGASGSDEENDTVTPGIAHMAKKLRTWDSTTPTGEDVSLPTADFPSLPTAGPSTMANTAEPYVRLNGTLNRPPPAGSKTTRRRRPIPIITTRNTPEAEIRMEVEQDDGGLPLGPLPQRARANLANGQGQAPTLADIPPPQQNQDAGVGQNVEEEVPTVGQLNANANTSNANQLRFNYTLPPAEGFPLPERVYESLNEDRMPAQTITMWRGITQLKALVWVFGYHFIDDPATLIDRVETILTHAGVAERITVIPPVKIPGAPTIQDPFLSLVIGLSAHNAEALFQIGVLSTTAGTLGIIPFNHGISRHTIGLEKITCQPAYAELLRDQIRGILHDSPAVSQFIANHHDALANMSAAEAMDQVLQSLEIRSLLLAIPLTGGFRQLWNLYLLPPTQVHATYTQWLCVLSDLFYLTLFGAGAPRLAGRCAFCKGTDHPSGLCPYPKLPGWKDIPVAAPAPAPTPATRARGGGRGRPGRARGRFSRGSWIKP